MSKIKVQANDETAQITFPRDMAHALRVALQPVPQGAVTSLHTQRVRDAFDKALARIDQK